MYQGLMNFDNRAEKKIEQFQDPGAAPQRAPMYDADAALRDTINKTEGNIHKVGDELLDRLKMVYVDSEKDNAR